MTSTVQFQLAGKTALVTGGASGIGLATARLLASSGATVAINHLPDDPAAPDVIAGLRRDGLDVVAAPGDVGAAYEHVRSMVAAACSTLGHLDYLVNNAATFSRGPIPHAQLDDVSDELWSHMLNVNVVGVYRCVRAARGALDASGGAIVNVASVAGFQRPGSSIPYGAAKAAVVKLTIDLARALAPRVRVNTVAPGLTRTPWTDPWPESRKQSSLERSLLGTLIEPDDIARAIVFMLAGTNSTTGQSLIVDAGISVA
jgi:3-oxoacyl-[acyl-carrier protein] reductase